MSVFFSSDMQDLADFDGNSGFSAPYGVQLRANRGCDNALALTCSGGIEYITTDGYVYQNVSSLTTLTMRESVGVFYDGAFELVLMQWEGYYPAGAVSCANGLSIEGDLLFGVLIVVNELGVLKVGTPYGGFIGYPPPSLVIIGESAAGAFPIDGFQHALEWSSDTTDTHVFTFSVAVDGVTVISGSRTTSPYAGPGAPCAPGQDFGYGTAWTLGPPSTCCTTWVDAFYISRAYFFTFRYPQCGQDDGHGGTGHGPVQAVNAIGKVELDNTVSVGGYAPCAAPQVTSAQCYGTAVVTGITPNLTTNQLTLTGANFEEATSYALQGPEGQALSFTIDSQTTTTTVVTITGFTLGVGEYCATATNPCS